MIKRGQAVSPAQDQSLSEAAVKSSQVRSEPLIPHYNHMCERPHISSASPIMIYPQGVPSIVNEGKAPFTMPNYQSVSKISSFA